MLPEKVKSEVNKKKLEAVQRYLNLDSSNLSDYRYQQGMIHGMDYVIKLIDSMAEDLDD